MESLLEKTIHSNESLLLPEDLLLDELSKEINELILQNFERLINLLYRIDVSELKLKQLLKEHPQEDAGRIIGQLIIERQKQKIKLRAEFSVDDSVISEEERW